MALLKQDETIFKQAYEKYEKAVQINPEYADAFYNWGTSLLHLAKMKKEEMLFRQVMEKNEKAAQINPEHALTFYNWGVALSQLARMKQDRNLFEQALEKWMKAYKIDPQFSYCLSCGYAFHGEKEKALYYLEESFKYNILEIETVKNNEDWKNYLSDKDLNNLINKYK